MTGARFVEFMLQPKLDRLIGRQAYEANVGAEARAESALSGEEWRAQAATGFYRDTAKVAQELYAILATSEPLVVRAPARALLTFRECATLDIGARTRESETMAKVALATCEATLAWLAKEGELGDENAAAEDPGGPDGGAALGLHPE